MRLRHRNLKFPNRKIAKIAILYVICVHTDTPQSAD